MLRLGPITIRIEWLPNFTPDRAFWRFFVDSRVCYGRVNSEDLACFFSALWASDFACEEVTVYTNERLGLRLRQYSVSCRCIEPGTLCTFSRPSFRLTVATVDKPLSNLWFSPMLLLNHSTIAGGFMFVNAQLLQLRLRNVVVVRFTCCEMSECRNVLRDHAPTIYEFCRGILDRCRHSLCDLQTWSIGTSVQQYGIVRSITGGQHLTT